MPLSINLPSPPYSCLSNTGAQNTSYNLHGEYLDVLIRNRILHRLIHAPYTLLKTISSRASLKDVIYADNQRLYERYFNTGTRTF